MKLKRSHVELGMGNKHFMGPELPAAACTETEVL
jgi:hypothetical protein